MKYEWKTKTLMELTSYISKGITPKYTDNYSNSTIIVLNQKCNRNFKISYEYARFHDLSQKKVPHEKILKNGDILINSTGTGTAGRIAQINNINQPVTIDGHMILMRPTKEVDNLYYGYALKSQQKQIELFAEGSTGQTEINKQRLINEILITYPSDIKIQHYISSILSALDDKIELNNKINENLEMQAQAIFKSWFVDFEPFGGVMPEDWKIKDIYSIANIIYGAPFKSKLFNTEKDGKPIVRIRDLKSNELTTFTTEIHPKGYLIQNGDIVVGMDGEFKPYIWGNNEAWLNQRVCVFDNIRENGKFFLYLTIKPLLNIVEQTEVATTVIHIGKSDFDSFEINLPNENILDKFDTITMPIYKLIVKNKLENKRLAELRDTLLPKLMNGEIDVDDVQVKE